MTQYYLRIEAANLGNFLDDTTDLSTIRGAGLMLLDAIGLLDLGEDPGHKQLAHDIGKLNALRDDLTKAGWCRISKGASSGLFSFNAENDHDAERLRHEIERFFTETQAYRHATFVVDVLPATNDFDADRESVLALNRWRQMQSPSLSCPPRVDAQEFCALTKLRPAETEVQVPSGEKAKVSWSVRKRRRFGRREKHDFYHRVYDEWRNKAAQHFEELCKADGDVGNLNRKMAVLYVDGNHFGKRQVACRTPRELRDWDEKIRELRRGMLNGLMDKVKEKPGWFFLRTKDKQVPVAEGERLAPHVLRMEVLMWGGDEFVFVLPAWHGWAVLRYFFEATQGEEWKFKDERLTHSAGLVFCKHNAPIARVKALAYKLCELAKSAGEKERDKFAYLTLESFDNTGLDLEKFFEGFLPKGFTHLDWVLPGDAAKVWEENIETLKKIVPSTRMQRVALDSARGAEIEADALWAAEESKAKKEEAEKAWQSLNPLLEIEEAVRLRALRAMHLSLLWDYVAPSLPNEWKRLQ